MPVIHVETRIRAPIERCFDLSRDLDLHVRSQVKASERAVAGRTAGLIEMNEWVTWEARHLGVTQRFTSRITAYERPRYFQDSMVEGAFQSFVHDHLFSVQGDSTVMHDRLVFEAPLGVLGRLANFVFLTRYMRRLLEDRAIVIRNEAEVVR